MSEVMGLRRWTIPACEQWLAFGLRLTGLAGGEAAEDRRRVRVGNGPSRTATSRGETNL